MLKKMLKKDYIFLDGAMGTMLQKNGLSAGERPELLCFSNEELILAIHRQYVESGSDIIFSNTFGANAKKLAGCGHSTQDVVKKAITLAKSACLGSDTLVALDVGPIGELLSPLGMLHFDEAYDIFAEILRAGASAGADLVVFETMTDLNELRAAVLAAKEKTALPMFATMTFDENGRTFTGCSAASMACTLEGLGVSAVGVNCSLGPKDLLAVVSEIAAHTSLPIIVKPNAGLPDPKTGSYDIGPEAFAQQMAAFCGLGVQIMGGCCGTTPDYIKALIRTVGASARAERTAPNTAFVCSPSTTLALDSVRVIGERINPSGKKALQNALLSRDLDYVVRLGIDQEEAGAEILDVNVSHPGVNEAALMPEVIRALQSVIHLPLQIDSTSPEVIEAGLRAYCGRAIINSVNGDTQALKTILPLAKKYGACVIGLTLDDNGLPETAQQRFDIACRILEAARSFGIADKNIIIDCLTLTVSAQREQAVETLKALRLVKEKLGLLTLLGVSNISFGLPNRSLITQTFLAMALACGLDLPIINPSQSEMMNCIAAYKVLSGADSSDYIARFSAETVKPGLPEPAGITSLETAIEKGLSAEAGLQAAKLLVQEDGLDIINRRLIPSLDRVGERFERGDIFLPQLLNSAAAAEAAFALIREALRRQDSAPASKGKIIVATVKGDIHDIGKNISKIILENYGYTVIDLGRDVPAETVVERALRDDVRLIGLSALMTTTLASMQDTISALRASGHTCKIFVGGAVLTKQYALQIGADRYVKDAKQAVDYAKEILGQDGTA